MLLLSVAINYLPPKFYSGVFKFSIGLMMLDFFLCLIWLPIGVSNTYGFRSANDVFTMTCKKSTLPTLLIMLILRQTTARELQLGGTGSYRCTSNYHFSDQPIIRHDSRLFTAGTLTGFDASGHIAEETKNARYGLRQPCDGVPV
jgi:translation initiation factor 5B